MTAETPHVSAVIPAYNAAAFIADGVESVLRQALPPMEVVVIDDGSSDQTADVVKRFGDLVTLVRKPRGGPGSARNTGIRKASGEWIAFLDADDLWGPERLRQQLDLAQRVCADFVFSDMSTGSGARTFFAEIAVDRHLRAFRNDLLVQPLEHLVQFGCFVSTPTVLVKRECLFEVGLFDESLLWAQDYDLWIRLAERYRFAYAAAPLVTRRRHANHHSSNRKNVVEAELVVMDKLEQRHARMQQHELQGLIAQRRAGLLRERGSLYLRAGDANAARQCWSRSLRLSRSPMIGLYWAVSFLPQAWLRRLINWKTSVTGTGAEVQSAAIERTSTVEAAGETRA